MLPPLAPAAETWARTTVLSKNCTKCAVALCSARAWKNASKTPVRLSRQNRFQTDPAYVERTARQIGLVKTNETVFRITNEAPVGADAGEGGQ